MFSLYWNLPVVLDAFPAPGLIINVLYYCFHFFLTRQSSWECSCKGFQKSAVYRSVDDASSRPSPSMSPQQPLVALTWFPRVSGCFCSQVKFGLKKNKKMWRYKTNRGCGVFMKTCNGCFQVFWCRFIFPCEFIVGYFWTSCSAAFSYSLLVVVDPALPLHLQKITSSVFIFFCCLIHR